MFYIYALIIVFNLLISYLNSSIKTMLFCDSAFFNCMRTWLAALFLLGYSPVSLYKILRSKQYYTIALVNAVIFNIISFMISIENNPQICFITYNLQKHFIEVHKGQGVSPFKTASIIMCFVSAILIISDDIKHSIMILALLAPFHFLASYVKLYGKAMEIGLTPAEVQCTNLFVSAFLGTIVCFVRDSRVTSYDVPIIAYFMPLVGMANGFYLFFLTKYSDIIRRMDPFSSFNNFFEIHITFSNFFLKEFLANNLVFIINNLTFDIAFLFFFVGNLVFFS